MGEDVLYRDRMKIAREGHYKRERGNRVIGDGEDGRETGGRLQRRGRVGKEEEREVKGHVGHIGDSRERGKRKGWNGQRSGDQQSSG